MPDSGRFNARWPYTVHGQFDPRGKRVLRGGSWNNNGRNLRSANRNGNEPDNRNNNIGFRLALAHTPAAAGDGPVGCPVRAFVRQTVQCRGRVSSCTVDAVAKARPRLLQAVLC